jgi:hypothetical protein
LGRAACAVVLAALCAAGAARDGAARAVAHGRTGRTEAQAQAQAAGHALSPLAIRLGQDAPLLPLLRALAALESRAARRGAAQAPVLVLQVGDSHSANDGFSGRMREILQARFGNGGRGLLPPGIPYAYYKPAGVHVEAEGWLRIGSFDKPRPAGTPPPPGADSAIGGIFGLTGLRQHAMAPATMTYTVDDPADLQRIAVEVMMQPRGGHLDVLLDGLPIGEAATDDKTVRAAWWQPPIPTGSQGGGGHVLMLHARGDGPVDVMGVLIARARPGLIWSNLGTIGATVELVGAWDRATVADELARLRPAAVALAFGTNEGFDDGLAADRYAADFAAAAARLAPPHGTLAVMGPPDGNRKVAGAAVQTPAPAAAPLPAPPLTDPLTGPPTEPLTAPLTAPLTDRRTDARTDPRSDRGAASSRDCGPASDSRGGPPGRWMVPKHLAPVRAAQAQVARAAGYWFWDWSDAMGGTCSMYRWTTAQPPLAYDDHVHLRAPGYRQTAEAMAGAILDAYRRFRGLPPPAPAAVAAGGSGVGGSAR